MNWEARIVKHKGESRIVVHFERKPDLIARMKALAGSKFSYTLKAWHLPDTEVNRRRFKLDAIDDEILVRQMSSEPTLATDGNEPWYLQAWYRNQHDQFSMPGNSSLNQKPTDENSVKQAVQLAVKINESEVTKQPPQQGRKPQLTPVRLEEVSVHHLVKVEEFKRWLRSKRYSDNTISTYADALKSFLVFYNHKAVNAITNDDVIRFNNDYILKYKLSASFQNQIVNAIKLFFRTIEDRRIDIDLVHRPKRAKLLPNVLSKEEVKLLLCALRNLKHRTMLALIYSCGLRRGELLSLKPADIDSNRRIIMVRQAKGRKDRVVPLSEKILVMLREYYKYYKPMVWLFEGQVVGTAYDERSLASVLKLALSRTPIKKPVTLHWLRHSYATHLLEAGTDLRYIQEILGHMSSRTTEIYTHVSTQNIQKIKSPFDDMDI